jgi:hypothetical protein
MRQKEEGSWKCEVVPMASDTILIEGDDLDVSLSYKKVPLRWVEVRVRRDV